MDKHRKTRYNEKLHELVATLDPPYFYYDDTIVFEHLGVYSYKTFIDCLKNPDIPKNSAELIQCMFVLELLFSTRYFYRKKVCFEYFMQ
jgi:hypothetical protein